MARAVQVAVLAEAMRSLQLEVTSDRRESRQVVVKAVLAVLLAGRIATDSSHIAIVVFLGQEEFGSES